MDALAGGDGQPGLGRRSALRRSSRPRAALGRAVPAAGGVEPRAHSAEIFEAAQAARVACYPLGRPPTAGFSRSSSPRLLRRAGEAELGALTVPGAPYHIAGAEPLHHAGAPPGPAQRGSVGEWRVGNRESGSRGTPRKITPRRGRVAERNRRRPHQRPVAAEPLSTASCATTTSTAIDAVAPGASTRPSRCGMSQASPAPTPYALRPPGCRLPTHYGRSRACGSSTSAGCMAGPICTKYLAALGAEVIKIESRTRPDLSQRDLGWEELNPSKRSITLNLKEERARELARRLIAQSDVVIENFSTGVMERLGLGYPALREINPRIIMASSSALGRHRPGARSGRVRHADPVLHRLGRPLGAPGPPPRSVRRHLDRSADGRAWRRSCCWRRSGGSGATGEGCFYRPLDGRDDDRGAAGADPGLDAEPGPCWRRAATATRSARRRAATRPRATTAGWR